MSQPYRTVGRSWRAAHCFLPLLTWYMLVPPSRKLFSHLSKITYSPQEPLSFCPSFPCPFHKETATLQLCYLQIILELQMRLASLIITLQVSDPLGGKDHVLFISLWLMLLLHRAQCITSLNKKLAKLNIVGPLSITREKHFWILHSITCIIFNY